MNIIQETMVKEFQCPGCVCGSSPEDGCFKQSSEGIGCDNHVAGTILYPIVGTVNLGLPIGFNRLGTIDTSIQKTNIRLYNKLEDNHYNKFNIPVWYYEYQTYLLVRTYLPRTNVTWVDIVKDYDLVTIFNGFHPINVGEFIEEID